MANKGMNGTILPDTNWVAEFRFKGEPALDGSTNLPRAVISALWDSTRINPILPTNSNVCRNSAALQVAFATNEDGWWDSSVVFPGVI